jgi:hypothetical protein
MQWAERRLKVREGQGMSNGGGDTSEEGWMHADHLTPQFLIVIQNDDVGNISRTETRGESASETLINS